MDIYKEFEDIERQHTALCNAVKLVGTDDEWIDEAIKNGLVVEDRILTNVSRKLETYGPIILIFTHKAENIGTYTHDKMIGSAKYTSYNHTWEVNNFKK